MTLLLVILIVLLVLAVAGGFTYPQYGHVSFSPLGLALVILLLLYLFGALR